MECIAITHVAFEDLGSFAAPLRERGYTIRYRQAGVAPLSPDEWLGADLIVVLGGPIGVGDLQDYPWLQAEIDGLRTRLAAKRPTLGVCLGAQLMAVALGGAVAPSGRFELGWHPLSLADAPGVLAPLAGIPVLHWHGDNIALPEGLSSLASTDGTPCQAFAVEDYALGLQFHAEFEPQALEAWLVGHSVELRHAGVDLAALRQATALHGAALRDAAVLLIRHWPE